MLDIQAALRKAMSAGASKADPWPSAKGPDSDVNVVRAATDIVLEQASLDEFLLELRGDPHLAALDQTFSINTSGGVPIRLESVARALLARSVETQDVSGSARLLDSFLSSNSATVLVVKAVAGLTVESEVALGPEVKLVPKTSLPPSQQRGDALANNFYSSEPSVIYRSAFVKEMILHPRFYVPGRMESEVTRARQHIGTAFQQLEEARVLLSVLGVATIPGISWVQAKEPFLGLGLGGTSLVSHMTPRFVVDRQIEGTEIERLAGRYYQISEGLRANALHVPLTRLELALNARDLTGQAIELGIALEALLVRDGDAELTFRMGIRGAWLKGRNPDERVEIFEVLKKLYKLRSRGVHRGIVETTSQNRETVMRGLELTRELIREVIQRGADVDWERLTFSG